MESEIKSILMDCLRHKDRLPEPMADIRKILETEGMGKYASVCINRIRQAGLIDDNHIMADCGPEGLSADAEGLEKARTIIEGYIDPGVLSSYVTAFTYQEAFTDYINNMLYTLWRLNRKELLKMRQDILNLKGSEKEEMDPELIEMELRQRHIWNKMRRYMEHLKLVWSAMVETRLPFYIIPIYLQKAVPCYRRKYHPKYVGGPYYKAFVRFEAKHKRRGKLSHDDLKRYVFLGVRAFGSEFLKNDSRKKSKSFHEIKWKYLHCKNIMEAIGKITPKDFMQMFPVDKNYERHKWGEKDYFFTMKRLGNIVQPIGTEQEAADFLWDYVNSDADFFFMNWLDVVDDLKIYCAEEEPYNKWYKERRKRYEVKRGDRDASTNT